MLSYLRGTLINIQKLGSSRMLLVLEVGGVGYELQILPRMVSELPEPSSEAQIYVHQQVREDQILLYGFSSAAQRDLFRQLVAVSGIGPQLAVALLDTFSMADLVQAIVGGKTRLLSKTPGVGPKTAERICLELKSKLSQWREQSGIAAVPDAAPVDSVQEDVEMTLLALGYSPGEIAKAVQAVGQSQALSKTDDAGEWIREAIAWLSR